MKSLSVVVEIYDVFFRIGYLHVRGDQLVNKDQQIVLRHFSSLVGSDGRTHIKKFISNHDLIVCWLEALHVLEIDDLILDHDFASLDNLFLVIQLHILTAVQNNQPGIVLS